MDKRPVRRALLTVYTAALIVVLAVVSLAFVGVCGVLPWPFGC